MPVDKTQRAEANDFSLFFLLRPESSKELIQGKIFMKIVMELWHPYRTELNRTVTHCAKAIKRWKFTENYEQNIRIEVISDENRVETAADSFGWKKTCLDFELCRFKFDSFGNRDGTERKCSIQTSVHVPHRTMLTAHCQPLPMSRSQV